MADYLPHFDPGNAITFTATADVTGGRLVEITGDRTVAHAAAASTKVAGVAGHDAAEGEVVVVYSSGVQRPIVAGAVEAGDRVAAAADGKVATAETGTIGLALAAAADGETASVRFHLA